jgi:hypothetical protein
MFLGFRSIYGLDMGLYLVGIYRVWRIICSIMSIADRVASSNLAIKLWRSRLGAANRL